MPNEQHIRSSLQASLQVGTAFLVAGTQEIERLTIALSEACEAVGWLLESYEPDENPGPGIRTDLARWRALLPPEARLSETQQQPS